MIYEYNDGFYVQHEDKWISRHLASLDIKVYKKFDIDFDIKTRPRLCEPDYRYNDWYNILLDKCPLFMTIVNNQEWFEFMVRSLCVYMGRCLYKVGEHDNWEHIPFLLGPPVTGKLTIACILRNFFIEKHVDDIFNILDGHYGLGLGKYVHTEDSLRFILGHDIGSNFNLASKEYANIAKGNTMLLNVTYAEQRIQKWSANLFLTGDSIPAKASQKFLKIFNFNNRPKKGVFLHLILLETGHILHACNRAYREATIEVCRKTIKILKLNDDVTNCILGYIT